jgi:hypothetical protein
MVEEMARQQPNWRLFLFPGGRTARAHDTLALDLPPRHPHMRHLTAPKVKRGVEGRRHRRSQPDPMADFPRLGRLLTLTLTTSHALHDLSSDDLQVAHLTCSSPIACACGSVGQGSNSRRSTRLAGPVHALGSRGPPHSALWLRGTSTRGIAMSASHKSALQFWETWLHYHRRS